MAKLVFGLKGGASAQKEIQDEEFKFFLGKKIGDKVKGDSFGYPGYEFKIAGGSDYCGFPMRWDVPGFQRKRILAIEGVGMIKTAKGMKHRKTVCGNTIHPKISQVNLQVLKAGPAPLAPPKEEKKEEAKEAPKAAPTPAPEVKKEEAKAKPEEKKAEAPKKEEKKAEEKKEEKPAEKPKAEEKKPEAKPAEKPKVEEKKAEPKKEEKPKEEKKPEAKPAKEEKKPEAPKAEEKK